MAKLGWLVAVALMAFLVVGATAPRDDSKQLEEIKALLTESNRLQRIDVHPRAYKHPLFSSCDFADRCRKMEIMVEVHTVERGLDPRYHPLSEACVNRDACKKVEAEAKANREKK